MKKSVILLSVLMCVVFMINAKKNNDAGDLVFENEQFKLVIGSNAIAKSLILKANGEECLMPGENMAIFSMTQERPYHNELKLAHPNKKTTFQANRISQEGDKLIVGFELVPWEAIIRVKVTPAYVAFNYAGFIVAPDVYTEKYLNYLSPTPAVELCLLQLPVRNRKYFGEWLNVSWDGDAAINVLATDEYAYIDFEKRTGYHLLTATAIKDIKFEDTGAALIVCHPDKLLDNIAQLEEDFHLPKGVESRRSDFINASYYWVNDINPDNVDRHIEYALKGGFRLMLIYFGNLTEGDAWAWDLIGDYEIDKKLYPNGKKDLVEMPKKIKEAGIIPGLQFMHSFIGRKSKYVTPVPDYRLNQLRRFNLSENLGLNDTVLFVEQNPAGCSIADGCRVLKVGTELISYEHYTTTQPYQFTGLIRGVDNTTINSLPKGYNIGLLDVNDAALSVYIDQKTSLQDEIAEKIAAIYDAGFQFVYFDGSEGVNAPFGHTVPLAQYRVYKRMNPAPLFAEGAAKSHFSWHMLSGGNAFDIFPPEILKEKIQKWPAEEAPRMRQDFTRINFGWLGYWIPGERSIDYWLPGVQTIGTQPDMWEYVTSIAAAWDCPISVWSDLKAFESYSRTRDNLEVVRRWEEVRAKHWLTEEQKKMLQNVHQEHHLLINEQNQFELVPYDQILDVAGGSKEVRAFIFQRQKEYYVVYWHISGDKKLELSLSAKDITLYEELGQSVAIPSSTNNKTVVPVGNRHYIKINNLTKEQLLDVLKNARIIE